MNPDPHPHPHPYPHPNQVNGCLSGLSTVFNEWLIKFQDPKAPLMFKNLLIYSFGVLITFGSWQPSAVQP